MKPHDKKKTKLDESKLRFREMIFETPFKRNMRRNSRVGKVHKRIADEMGGNHIYLPRRFGILLRDLHTDECGMDLIRRPKLPRRTWSGEGEMRGASEKITKPLIPLT